MWKATKEFIIFVGTVFVALCIVNFCVEEKPYTFIWNKLGQPSIAQAATVEEPPKLSALKDIGFVCNQDGFLKVRVYENWYHVQYEIPVRNKKGEVVSSHITFATCHTK